MAANKDWYDSQPEVVQKALKDACVDYRHAYHEDLKAAVAAAYEAMTAAGATVREVDDAMRKQWADGMDNVAKVWAAKMDGEGQPGTAVLKRYMDAMRAAGAAPVRDWDAE